MIKVLMVCLGNICRSPMAEMIMADEVRKLGLDKEIIVDSAGTSNEEEGNSIYPSAKNKLRSEGIAICQHFAKQITAQDGNDYDYILGMESWNIKSINRIIGDNKKAEVKRLLDYSDRPRDISDPWYSGDFDMAYTDIKEGVDAFLNYLMKKKLWTKKK